MRSLALLMCAGLALISCGDDGQGNANHNANQNNQSQALCGNGVVEAAEECDDGPGNSDVAPDACRTDCRLARCGDGAVDTGEGCDDGPSNSDHAPGACRSDCQPWACGDGVVDDGEECDDGAGNADLPNVPCRTTCRWAACGDGIRDDLGGEACDDGPDNSATRPDACRPGCLLPRCGDGVADTGELCDDGNAVAGDGCSPLCRSETCGNGTVDAAQGEQCDDGNATSRDGCSSGCTAEILEWRLLRPAENPPQREFLAMAYDRHRERVVLFGGMTQRSAWWDRDPDNDTWEFDGTAWARVFTPTVPSERYGHMMAYDEARRRVVLFGGLRHPEPPGETWEYDGVDWIRRAPATSPPAKFYAAMAYDAARERTVLYGGVVSDDGWRLDDSGTWVWDGLDWATLPTTDEPGPREAPAMAYDRARERVVLFGGNIQADTWELDGDDWVPVPTPTVPLTRSFHAMAFHETLQAVVVSGGQIGNGDFDSAVTWAYAGQDWWRVSEESRVGPRRMHALAALPALGAVVLFGYWPEGRGGPPDTWVLGYEGGWPDERCDASADVDLDGLAGCADPDCEGRPCGAAGHRCSGGNCGCPGAAVETDCANGADDDCDGLPDCRDPDCAGAAPCEASETRCADGLDNDGDGAVDCADPDCRGRDGCALSLCGDGVREGAERCDGADLASHRCATLGPGLPYGVLACRPDCSGFDLSGCLAPGCGNDVIEPGEVCDGADVGWYTCWSAGYGVGGTLGCQPDCLGFDPTGCDPPLCGNHVREGDEVCDGPDVPESCYDLGYVSGVLRCLPTCDGHDETGCVSAACGNGAWEGDEACDDGNLVGGDGCSATCQLEPGVFEPDDTAVLALVNHHLGGGTVQYACLDVLGDRDYVALTVPDSASIRVRVVLAAEHEMSDFWLVLYAPDATTVLAGTQGYPSEEAVIDPLLDPRAAGLSAATYFLGVWSMYSNVGTGCYRLEIEVAVCGDGIQASFEQCEDGNLLAGDGCDPTCRWELPGELEPNGTPATATLIETPASGAAGVPIEGTIGTAGDVDYYRVDVPADGAITARTFGLGGPGTCDTDTLLTLLASDGVTVLAQNDDGGFGACSEVSELLVTAGQSVYIAVQHFYASDTGAYLLQVDYWEITCGNGVREPGEECDGSDLRLTLCSELNERFGDEPLGCLPTCRFDQSACRLEGCGDGSVSWPEHCDGADLNGVTCDGLGYRGGTLACAPSCASFDTSGCTPTECGNQAKEPGEVCDGYDLDWKDCDDLGFGGGVLRCQPDCLAFDTSECTPRVCGNGRLETGERCDDGNTVSGDGCSSGCLAEGTEREPNNTPAEALANNQWTGSFAATGAIQPAGDVDVFAVVVPEGAYLRARWLPASGLGTSGCTYDAELRVLDADGVTVRVTYSSSGSGACRDADPYWYSEITDLPAGTYYVELRYDSTTRTGSYVLLVDVAFPTCGNGVREPGEQCDGEQLGSQCDDQGFAGGVLRCAASCQAYDTSECVPSVCGNGVRETGERCDGPDLDGHTCAGEDYLGGVMACTAGCQLDESGCTPPVCGNGIQEAGEDCDGADLGYSWTDCQDVNWYLDGGNLACTVGCLYDLTGCTMSTCGNGVIDSGERCDGAELNGWTCEWLGYQGGVLACLPNCYDFDTSGCLPPECGNGILELGEGCDGQDFDYHSCIREGFAGGDLRCTAACERDTSECLLPECGNGILEVTEHCDDGNLVPGDGCDAACRAEGVEHEPNGTPAEALANNAFPGSFVVQAAIQPTGDVDLFAVDVPEGASIRVEVFGREGLFYYGYGAWNELRLLAPDGVTVLAEGSFLDPYVTWSSLDPLQNSATAGLTAGTYYVSFRLPSGDERPYVIHVEVTPPSCGNGLREAGEQCDDGNLVDGDGCSAGCAWEHTEVEPNDSPAQALANDHVPGNGEAYVASFGVPGDEDWFAVDVPEGASLRIETFDQSGPGSCQGIDTTVTLFAPDGTTQLAFDDDDGIDWCSLVDPALDLGASGLAAGTYLVRVRDYGSDQSYPYVVAILVDRPAGCGDGVADPGELCDGVDLGGESCASQGFASGTLRCDSSCSSFDTTECVEACCGNDTIETVEVCDGVDLGGESCASLGYAGGTLRCDFTCSSFDTTECVDVGCGNGIVEAGEQCDDGNLVAGDGCDPACQAEIWCNLQWPPTLAGEPDVPTELVYGRVWVVNVTPGEGQGAGVLAELGYGAPGSDPATDPSWQWTPADYNVSVDGLFPGDLANDEYQARITPTGAGTFAYAYRVSLDGGLSFFHCDLDGSLGPAGYDPSQAGELTVAF
jgi:cysteine-rich repeat protein